MAGFVVRRRPPGHWSGLGLGLGLGWGRSGCWYEGCPPPPLGPPGPTRMTGGCGLNGWSGTGAGGGPPGSAAQSGHGGGGSNGAALTCPVPPVSAAMPTPTAIRAAAARRLTSISVLLPDIHHVDYQLPGRLGADASKQWQTATPSSCPLRIATTVECSRMHRSRWMGAAKRKAGYPRSAGSPATSISVTGAFVCRWWCRIS
jgi:hypothetical protein